MSIDSLSSPIRTRPAAGPWAEITFADRLRLTRDAFHALAESGVIDDQERVELLNGEIVPMLPVGPWHTSVTDKLTHHFACRAGGRFICRNQGPQATDTRSEPEPDFQLLRLDDSFYRDDHPAPRDVLLAIEVAESSLAKDLGPKMRIYAAAGIVEYWVVDLVNRRLHVHTDPDTNAAVYRSVVVMDDTQKAAPRVAEDCKLDLAWLFGPSKQADTAKQEDTANQADAANPGGESAGNDG